MINIKGFTLVEIVAVLIILCVLAVIVVNKYSDPGVDSVIDASTIKVALRQTIMNAMSDLSSSNWNISVGNKEVQIKNENTSVAIYELKKYDGSFSIQFDNLGQPQNTPSLPYSITIDPITGYIP